MPQTADGQEFTGDEILVAVGRRPATAGIGLDRVGLEPGRPVPVDGRMRAAGVPAVFARILDPGGGHFSIRPAGDFQAGRAYVSQTMALETTFVSRTGTAVLTDAMAMGRNERGHELGMASPGVLLRRLACTAGEMDIEVSYAPRPEYGLIHPILEAVPGGVAARGGAGRLLLSAPSAFAIDGATAATGRRTAAMTTRAFTTPRSTPPIPSPRPSRT
jgi:hypothetical protein